MSDPTPRDPVTEAEGYLRDLIKRETRYYEGLTTKVKDTEFIHRFSAELVRQGAYLLTHWPKP